MLDAHELARRLREAMDNHKPKVSSAAMATACGVTPQAVNSWRTTGRLAKRHLQKIAELVGKPLAYFLDATPALQQQEAAYLMKDEEELLAAYRRALPRWRIALKHMVSVRPERQDEVAEALLILIAKIAAEPVSDKRVEDAYGKVPHR